MARPVPQTWTGSGWANPGFTHIDDFGLPVYPAGTATPTATRNPTGGRISSAIKIDMSEIDLAGKRMREAAKHYTATTGYRASSLIKKQIQIKLAPELKKTIAYAASIAPRGNRKSSGKLRQTAAYNYQPVPRSKALYDYRIQVGKSKGRGANPIAKAVAPYVMFPFWQGGTQTGYNWSAPKEWLWRASERREKQIANAARNGIEAAYDTMIDAKAGKFM